MAPCAKAGAHGGLAVDGQLAGGGAGRECGSRACSTRVSWPTSEHVLGCAGRRGRCPCDLSLIQGLQTGTFEHVVQAAGRRWDSESCP